jgi:LPXTG-motif cell wall-anchored protein
MYDLAKRSLAFTVATGGLLLSGPGYAPLAEAAVAGFGNSTGPNQASGVAESHAGNPSALSAPLNLREARPLKPELAAPAPAPRSAPAAAGASANSAVTHSGGILAGNTVQVPIDLGLDLCGTNVLALTVKDMVGQSTCTAPTGSSANVVTDHSGGILSGNTVQAPVNVPILACGTTVAAVALKDGAAPSVCEPVQAPGTGGGAGATAVNKHSGGILSGNIVQAPVNVPVDLCGNSAVAGGIKSGAPGADCSPAAGPAGGALPPGASATAVQLNSGGIGSGSIVQAPISVPLTGCDNHAGLVEIKDATGSATSCMQNSGGSFAAGASVDSGGVASGLSAQAPVDAPVQLCGDTAVVGSVRNAEPDSPALCGEMPGEGGAHSISVTAGNGGIVTGDTVAVPIAVPVQGCGDTVEGVALKSTQAGAICSAGTSASTVTTTTDSGGIGSAAAVGVPGAAPVLICGADVPVGSVGEQAAGASCGSQPPVLPYCPPPPPPICVTPPVTPPGGPTGWQPTPAPTETAPAPGPSTVPGSGPTTGPSTSPTVPVMPPPPFAGPTPPGAPCFCVPPPPPCTPTAPPTAPPTTPVYPPPPPPSSPPTAPPTTPVYPPPPPPSSPPTAPPTAPPTTPVYPPPPPPSSPPSSPPTAPPTTPVYPPPPPPPSSPPTAPPTTPVYPPPPPPSSPPSSPPTAPPTTPVYPPPPPPSSPPSGPPTAPAPPGSTTPPGVPPSSPPTTPGTPGRLANTGGEEGLGFAVAGGTLLAGLGFRFLNKRKTRKP